ncbi:MAG: glycosyltransferase family 2 protein, partial [Phycisphaerales bacterium]
MTPTVSVIVPMHNAAATIGDSLASLRVQTWTDWEGVVVDDASTDGSVAAAVSLAQRNPRLRVIANRRARGPSGARNTGIDASTGRFVTFLDADDWLTPTALTDLVATARANPGACAFGGMEHRGPAGEDLRWRVAPATGRIGLDDLLGEARLTIGALAPRAVLADDRFDESLTICEDMDLWLRLAARAVAFAPATSVTYAYRLRPGSLTRRFAAMREQHERVLRAAFERCGSPDDARLRVGLQREALLLATMGAFAEGVEAGAAIFEHAWLGTPLDPMQAVDLALWGLPYAACRSRHDWADLPVGWPEALGAWWASIERSGWAGPGFIEACASMLAARAVSNERVAERICDEIGDAPRVTLLGFGANGRLLAERLLGRGRVVEVRDDRIDAGVLVDMPDGVTNAPMECAPGAGAVHVITTLDDRWMERRIGARAEAALRWSTVRRAMIERL